MFNGEIEIEHLIPFSRSLDDSVSNKVVCFREANRDKGSRTPFEAFYEHPNYNWDNIFDRTQELPKTKRWRFESDAIEKWNKFSEEDFTTRHLNDTRYISRLAKEYLENVCHFNKIDVVTGRLTALLRRYWGLESVLTSGFNENNQTNVKNRDDHRHHAVDAIVVGMTARSMIQKLSTVANRSESIPDPDGRIFANITKGAIDPWNGFRCDVAISVNAIVVSHKVRSNKRPIGTNNQQTSKRSQTDGQLHKDTAYGIISFPEERGDVSEVVVRRPIDYLTTKKRVNKIRDDHLRHQFLAAYNKDQKVGVLNLAAKKGIRSVRCIEHKTVIPLKNSLGEVYKGVEGRSNWGVEIYSYPVGHKKAGEWIEVLISRFEANQSGFRLGFTYRPHPAAKLVMRLQIDDCIEIENENRNRIMRLQKVSKSFMEFAEHNEANVASRNEKKDDPFSYWRKSASSLKKFNPKKIYITPIGNVLYARNR